MLTEQQKKEYVESEVGEREGRANANLIASAPELYDGLAELIRAIDAYREVDPEGWKKIKHKHEGIATDIGQAVWDGKMILKKARGES